MQLAEVRRSPAGMSPKQDRGKSNGHSLRVGAKRWDCGRRQIAGYLLGGGGSDMVASKSRSPMGPGF